MFSDLHVTFEIMVSNLHKTCCLFYKRHSIILHLLFTLSNYSASALIPRFFSNNSIFVSADAVCSEQANVFPSSHSLISFLIRVSVHERMNSQIYETNFFSNLSSLNIISRTARANLFFLDLQISACREVFCCYTPLQNDFTEGYNYLFIPIAL